MPSCENVGSKSFVLLLFPWLVHICVTLFKNLRCKAPVSLFLVIVLQLKSAFPYSAILSCLPKEYIVDTVLWVTSKFTPVTLVMDDNSIDDELMETICEKLNNAEYKLQLLR